MVLLTITPQISQAIQVTSPSTSTTIRSTESGTPITHNALIELSHQSKIPLNTLLRGTSTYIPPPPPHSPKSPEYISLMTRLQAQEDQRRYLALLNQQKRDDRLDFTTTEGEEDPISPSLVLNIMLSVVMCAVAMMYLTRWWRAGSRVLMSLGTAIVVAVAETVVYAAYLRKVRDAKRKEATRKEVKVLMEGDGGGQVVVSEKEEVWGKGMNGGVRRRVREKWSKEQAGTS